MSHLLSTLFLVVVAAVSSIATPYLGPQGPDGIELDNAIPKLIRSANTCADPALAQTSFQAFHPDILAHVLNFRYGWQNLNTRAGAAVWGDQQAAFRAWPAQQPFTVPLFQLGAADRRQYIYMIGADAATPPIVAGFDTDVVVVAWVYDTPVCGSVPLMSAVFPAQTDRYFTISAFEHDSLVTMDGWVDTGIIAFVLPLSNS